MRTFHCVYTFPVVDYVLEGVFSKLEDAVALAKEINPKFDGKQSTEGSIVIIAEMTRQAIIDQLLEEGLRGLYEPIKKLAGMGTDSIPDGIYDNRRNMRRESWQSGEVILWVAAEALIAGENYTVNPMHKFGYFRDLPRPKS